MVRREEMIAQTVVGAFMVLVVLFLVGALATDVVMTNIRRGHERAAVRAALAGDCATGLQHAKKAGEVPIDFARLCMGGY